MVKKPSAPVRTVMIGVRTKPEIKRAAERAAKAENRTLSSWCELTILARLQELKEGKK
jgi:uncharacterized protein (DUF1778 family)